MDGVGQLTDHQVRGNALLAYGSAIVALTGVQLIAPSLPSMRTALGLSEAQLGLVMSVYLLPAALAAIPLGVAADRLGRRRVLGLTTLAFGVTGGLLQFATVFPVFLGIRFLQGVAFAGVMPLTMTVLGDVFGGSDLIRAHGRRSVVMAVGDGILPVVGGALVTFGWFVPWLGQLLAIPLGIAILAKLVDVPALEADEKKPVGVRAVAGLLRSKAIAALQYVGFLRMFLKFSLLTFLPVLLVGDRGVSPAFAGLVLGSTALSGSVIAASAGWISTKGRPAWFVALGIGTMAASIMVMAVTPYKALVLLVAVVYGAGDGLLGVFTNSFVTSATGPDLRASFVAVTGAIRNFAKFAAPSLLGLVILSLSIQSVFLIVGAIALVSTAVALPLRRLEAGLIEQEMS